MPHISRELVQMLAIFIGRHWLVGLSVGMFTYLLGLFVLFLFTPILRATGNSAYILRAKYALVVVSLIKTAFYMLVGDNRGHMPSPIVALSMQLPGPYNIIPTFHPSSGNTIWQHTPVTEVVTLIALTFAAAGLVCRAVWFIQMQRAFRALARVQPATESESVRLSEAVCRAAQELKIKRRLPNGLIVPETPGPSPFVAGIFAPSIVISRNVLSALTDGELEVAMRHELTNILRRDHIWKWILMWLRDISRVTILGPYLMVEAATLAEEICDWRSIKGRPDAGRLAAAVAVALHSTQSAESRGTNATSNSPRKSTIAVPSQSDRQIAELIPGLAGVRESCNYEDLAIPPRLKRLVKLASAQSADEANARPENAAARIALRLLGAVAIFVTTLLLVIFCYAKIDYFIPFTF